MGKNKLPKFAEMKSMSCVFEPPMDLVKIEDFKLKGNWNKEYFKNDNPIILELGCGKGEYTVNLAKKFPNQNFIGIDIKGARMWKGAKTVEDENLTNAAFLRSKIEFITRFFDENEVSEIWLTFSDPQPKKPNKRLSSYQFIQRYKQILKENGIIHVKTDSPLLYEFTNEEILEHNYKVLHNTANVYGKWLESASNELKEILSIQTHYEKLFIKRGHIITYCAFQP